MWTSVLLDVMNRPNNCTVKLDEKPCLALNCHILINKTLISFFFFFLDLRQNPLLYSPGCPGIHWRVHAACKPTEILTQPLVSYEYRQETPQLTKPLTSCEDQ